MSNAALVSGTSLGGRVEVVALHKVRRALRRKSARVRLLILPSLRLRPTLRLLVVSVATTDTSLSNMRAGASLLLPMVSFMDSSCVRPDLRLADSVLAFAVKHRNKVGAIFEINSYFWPWYSSKNFSFHTSTFFSFSIS